VIPDKPEAIAGKCVTLMAIVRLACRYSVPPTPSWFELRKSLVDGLLRIKNIDMGRGGGLHMSTAP